MRKRVVELGCAFLAVAAVAAAQPAIKDVMNAASRIPSGFPSYGIAQGALFAVTGTGLGPDQLQQASFPLPATDGLAGVTVQVKVGGSTVDAIMVYVSATEVGAILPSATPLGTGAVTVNNNGSAVTAPITVVKSAFGAFSLDYYSGVQSAAAFNVTGDGSTTLNLSTQPGQSAQPGQTVALNGTGLGAISSDETQSGATDVPNAQISLFVGNKPAAVISAGRGPWIGLPDGFRAFPVPQTVAAWDVIQFTVPDGVLGCRLPVVVQTGNFVSNFAWISIAPDGGPCVDPNTADFGDEVTLSQTARIGNINMLRTLIRDTRNGLTTEIGSEIGTANFFQFDVPTQATVRVSDFAYASLAANLDPGTCVVQTFRSVLPASPAPNPNPTPPAAGPTILDAGNAINLKGPTGATQHLMKSRDGSYGGGIGSSFSLPGVPAANTLFINPGTFTADNGTGGAGVPAFTGTVTVPNPILTFDNIDQISAIDRTKSVTVKWSGGDPSSFVNINGSSINRSRNVTLIGNFSCSERISAGQFTIPAFVTLALPVTADPQLPIGTISLWTYALNRIQIPTVDIAVFSVVLDVQKGVLYQ